MEPQKRKYVTQITDGRGAASYVGDNRHTHWKKGTRHDLDFGPHGRRALHRPRHAHCAVVDLHSGLKARTASSAHPANSAVLIFKRLPLATAGALLFWP
jgi:hypothetical protein